MQKVVAVVGTNASGKSDLGVRLALAFNGEIISADSRQVFRGLDLGSGKITEEEMQGIPHHMIDIRDPGEFVSMADFQRLSFELIPQISRLNLQFRDFRPINFSFLRLNSSTYTTYLDDTSISHQRSDHHQNTCSPRSRLHLAQREAST